MHKQILKNSSYTLIGQIVILFLGLIFAGMTIRYLGESKAGFFILISTILGWVQLAGGGAFHAPAVRELAIYSNTDETAHCKNITKTIITANLLTGLPFVILTIVFFPLIFSWSKLDEIYRNQAFIVVIIISISFLFDQYSGGLRAVHEGFQKYEYLVFVKLFNGLIGNIFRLLILIFTKDMILLSIITLLVSIFSCFIDMYFVNKLIGGGYFPGWKKGLINKFLNFGLWSWLGNTGNFIYFNLTSLVLVKALGAASLMYVSLPQTIILSVAQLIIVSVNNIFPALANFKEHTYDIIYKIEDRYRWIICVLSFLVFVGLYLSGPLLFTHLVSENYSLYANAVFVYLCIYGIVWGQEVFYVFATMAVGKGEINTIVNLVTSILTLLFTYFLIKKYGYIGYGLAQLLILPSVIWHLIWSRRILRLSNSFKEIFNTYFSSIIGAISWISFTTIVTYFIKPNVLFECLSILIGLIIFILTVYFIETKFYLEKNRIQSLKPIFRYLVLKLPIRFQHNFNKILN
jgi:O-antigen/teichoic acid export membrane protein